VRVAVGGGSVNLAPGGPANVKSVGVITGGAGSQIAEIAAQGVDTFITGEGPHHTYTLAEELGVNLIYAGHYATETFGVKALAAHLAQEFDLEHEFVDHPTGL
jgi:putative NIF3 family GTP cyclohydrolase 1 type 2